MLIARYYFWLLIYHLVTIHRQKPFHFISGLLLCPMHFLLRFMQNPAEFPEKVVRAVDNLGHMWAQEMAIPAPAFVRKQFMLLQSDARKQL
jgi:hypothetical protein